MFYKSKASLFHSHFPSVNPMIVLEDLPLRSISKVRHTQESSSLRLWDINWVLSNLKATLPFIESLFSRTFHKFSSLTISGKAYLTITSSACMAGGKLSAVYLIYNWLEQLFSDAGIVSLEHADFGGIVQLALVTGGEIL